MYFGIKSRIAIFLLIILFFSILVYAGGIPEIMNETNITDPEIHDFNFSNFTVYEVNITNISFGNRPPLVDREVLDLSIEEIYFDNDLKLNEELFLVVKVKSDSRSEVTAEVIVEVTGEKEFQNKKTFTEKREVTFTKEAEISFGPIVFEEAGDYEIISEIKSSALEKDRNNNELTGLFFFPFLSCEDGTYIGECNEELLYCEGGYLIEDCNQCGCQEGFECFEGECVEIVERDGGIETRSYVYVGNKRVAEIKEDGINYYHTDNLGSVRKVTDQNGSVVLSIDYYPFGSKFSIESGGVDINYEYTGKEFDDSGLNYYGARYYDSNLGRFVTSDPIGHGINWYAYVGNNPMNRIDPTGLSYVGANLYSAGLNLIDPVFSGDSIVDSVEAEETDAQDAALDEIMSLAILDGIENNYGDEDYVDNVHSQAARNLAEAAKKHGYRPVIFDTFTPSEDANQGKKECIQEELGIESDASRELKAQGFDPPYGRILTFSGGGIIVDDDDSNTDIISAGYSATPKRRIHLVFTDLLEDISFIVWGGQAYEVTWAGGHTMHADTVSQADYHYFKHPNRGKTILGSSGIQYQYLGVNPITDNHIHKLSLMFWRSF